MKCEVAWRECGRFQTQERPTKFYKSPGETQTQRERKATESPPPGPAISV